MAKQADDGHLPWNEVRTPLDTCLGCRACETACPSGVRYAEILEQAKERVRPSLKARALVRVATGRVAMAVAGCFARSKPPQRRPLRLEDLPAVREEVRLLDGCGMRDLFTAAQDDAERLLRRAGFAVRRMELCCGALHAHASERTEGLRRAESWKQAVGRTRVVTTSAGCGAWLREHEVRCQDLSEVLLEAGLTEPLSRSPLEATVTYHDACHLAHGQGVTTPPRELLAAIPGLNLIPLANADACCGSAGLYSFLQPKTAARLRDQKWRSVEATGATQVVMGNPGCLRWLATDPRSDRIRVRHLAELLEDALDLPPITLHSPEP